jgi:hypothetical protein
MGLFRGPLDKGGKNLKYFRPDAQRKEATFIKVCKDFT